MEKKGNYRESVKKAIRRCSNYAVRESESSSEGITYTTKFETKKGTSIRKMDILVNEEQETIRMKMFIEEDIQGFSKAELLKHLNEIQRKWLYGRMYLTCNDEWIADYMAILSWQGESGRAIFEENAYEIVKMISNIFMNFVEKGEAVLQELKYGTKKNLNQQDFNLNPFE
ncbi:MAG: hypothetical protein J6A75_02685 [Lachnospiraceae bacterium]|nr:hypothetical protein [Lachnospiraceae bacterium]